jgi:hypothetical protein
MDRVAQAFEYRLKKTTPTIHIDSKIVASSPAHAAADGEQTNLNSSTAASASPLQEENLRGDGAQTAGGAEKEKEPEKKWFQKFF